MGCRPEADVSNAFYTDWSPHPYHTTITNLPISWTMSFRNRTALLTVFLLNQSGIFCNIASFSYYTSSGMEQTLPCWKDPGQSHLKRKRMPVAPSQKKRRPHCIPGRPSFPRKRESSPPCSQLDARFSSTALRQYHRHDLKALGLRPRVGSGMTFQ
jgi:hypothetical protein